MKSKLTVQCRMSFALFKSWMLLCIFLSVVHHPRAVRATDDVVNISPCELESIINQLANPNSGYQLHASALRSQLRNLLRDRQLELGEEQSLNDYDYPEEDKRSVAALAAQGLLHPSGAKRSLATLAKNGQLPTVIPEDGNNDNEGRTEEKRYIGSLARSGNSMGYGKRNVGTLARDFQLPQNGKRNMATLARLGLLNSANRYPKRNVASVARYNSKGRDSNGDLVEKRNLGALKGSPVHGAQQKREEEEYLMPSFGSNGGGGGGVGGFGSTGGQDMEYYDTGVPNYGYNSYWWYPNYVGYADLDWGDFGGRAQKRFLDTSKDPELFGIENAGHRELEELQQPHSAESQPIDEQFVGAAQKRHIGAVYRSGFLPSYRALRSTTGIGDGGMTGKGRFSRSGRARQFVEYYPQLERLRQPTAAVCKRCFLPTYRPMYNWGFSTSTRGRYPKYIAEEEYSKSINTNSLPTATVTYQQQHTDRHPMVTNINERNHSWGTPPRIAALHRRAYRGRNSNDNNNNNNNN